MEVATIEEITERTTLTTEQLGGLVADIEASVSPRADELDRLVAIQDAMGDGGLNVIRESELYSCLRQRFCKRQRFDPKKDSGWNTAKPKYKLGGFFNRAAV